MILAGMISFPAFGQTNVHVLDVGQGLSVLIESDGHYMLYDGGDSHKSSYVVSYLQNEQVSSLDYMVASHYDSDHLNGVVGALNAFPVKQVWGPSYETDTKVYQSFCSAAEEKGLSVVQPSVGSKYSLGASASAAEAASASCAAGSPAGFAASSAAAGSGCGRAVFFSSSAATLPTPFRAPPDQLR